jgi:D-tyrosyl-tRNA(Tyr) deacylase
VDGRVSGEIERGLVVFVAVGRDDAETVPTAMAAKVANLRIFDDALGKMNLSLGDVGGVVLAVSQFTLYGDTHGQRRPSFLGAAPAEQGRAGYEEFVRALRELGVRVETGVFQAHMSVEITNDGPVTILIDSTKLF